MTRTMTMTKKQVKTNPKQGPDYDSILGSLKIPGIDNTTQIHAIEPQGTPLTTVNNNDQGRLWDEFNVILNDPEEDPEIERSKLYAIDDDIVETLHQCNFGKPNVHVINSILRTFLIDNIAKLREMHRPRSKSLLDKYD